MHMSDCCRQRDSAHAHVVAAIAASTMAKAANLFSRLDHLRLRIGITAAIGTPQLQTPSRATPRCARAAMRTGAASPTRTQQGWG